MPPGKSISVQKQQISFEAVLDETCRVLEDKQIQYSIRRLREMEAFLEDLERELNDFVENSG